MIIGDVFQNSAEFLEGWSFHGILGEIVPDSDSGRDERLQMAL